MQALRFDLSWPRVAVTKVLSLISHRACVAPWAPIGLREIPEPQILQPDWVVVRTKLVGICGSDLKQVLLDGDVDTPMSGLISFPQVLGHEAVGVVERVGPQASRVKPGDRVVINPWLSCRPRGIAPVCDSCAQGRLYLCRNFLQGHLPPGIHSGNNRLASGAFAPFMPVHESQCFLIPAGITDEQAVLSDPFSVSLHGILDHPPPENGTALIYGAGALGLMAVAGLRALYPKVRIMIVVRHKHQAEQAKRFGADETIQTPNTTALIETVGNLTGAPVVRPWKGRPMLMGGVDIIYDAVGSPQSIETGVRITRERGKIVVTGVAAPRRFEWTPLYFKEISVVGSNAFGVETFKGERLHAFEIYLRLVQQGLDVSPLVTHKFPLHRWKEAFMTMNNRHKTGGHKIALEFD